VSHTGKGALADTHSGTRRWRSGLDALVGGELDPRNQKPGNLARTKLYLS